MSSVAINQNALSENALPVGSYQPPTVVTLLGPWIKNHISPSHSRNPKLPGITVIIVDSGLVKELQGVRVTQCGILEMQELCSVVPVPVQKQTPMEARILFTA